MNSEPIYYLSSLESSSFEPVRECRFVRHLQFDTGKDAVLVKLEPGVLGQDFNSGDELSKFVLATRFEGASLSPVNEFPCFVFIALPHDDWSQNSASVRKEDLQVVAWGGGTLPFGPGCERTQFWMSNPICTVP